MSASRTWAATEPLVLSIFPGLDVLGMGFEAAGWCVVRGPDVLWGGDVREFHPPAGVFDGVIGGDPCQSHSALANLVRAKGLEPRFGDLSGEYQRIVEEAEPRWFLRENVPRAPDIAPEGYGIRSFLLDNAWLDSGGGLGEEQMRKRRFWFGLRGSEAPDLRCQLKFAALELPTQAQTSDVRSVPVRLGGSGKVKRMAVLGKEAGSAPFGHGLKAQAVTGRHTSHGMGSAHPGNPPRYSLDEMLELQGLSPGLFEHSPFTAEAKRKLVGNAVPLRMAQQLAHAIRHLLAEAVT